MADSGPVTAVPVVLVSQHKENYTGPIIRPSDLPSAKFKYDIWHELQRNTLNADDLKYPRIRKGPHPEDRHDIQDTDVEEDEETGKQDRRWLATKRNHRNEHENWEDSKLVNLSYQNLGDSYQVNNLMRVVGRLQLCVELQLTSNELRDLSSIRLPQCKMLNLTSNHIRSFKDLPACKVLQHLNLTENNINSLDGIERLKTLKSLLLTRNPVSYSFDYRPRVFRGLSNLCVLDGIPKLKEDEELDYPNEKGSCTIC